MQPHESPPRRLWILAATGLLLSLPCGFGAETDPVAAPPAAPGVASTNAAARKGGDVLVGTNGERFTGKVIEETADVVVFESELGGRFTVPRARVLELQRASPPATDHRLLITNTPPAPSATNPWQPPGVGRDGADWIQLKSGEWLRGRLKYIQDKKVEFDSDELKDLSLDLKKVRQVYPAKALFTKFDGREQIYGTVVVSNDIVHVVGPEQVSLPRDQLTGITPGGKKEIDFWSGQASVGLSLQAGNTRQSTETASAELARRTPATVAELNYLGNFSEVSGQQNANNHRINANYDIRLNRDWFLRPVQIEYYRDQLANIGMRLTAGVALGYYIFDRDGLKWLVSGGPGFQDTHPETVETNQADYFSTPAAVFSSSFKADITDRLKFIQTFGATFTSSDAGFYTHHAVSTLEFEIKRHLDLNVSFVWDYLAQPQAESNGSVPQHSDYRLNLGIGIKF